MRQQTLFISFSLVFVTSAGAAPFDWDEAYADRGRSATLVCHDAVPLPGPLTQLGDPDRSALVRDSEDFKKTTSALTLSLEATEGGYQTPPTATMKVRGGAFDQSLRLKPLTLSLDQVRGFKRFNRRGSFDEDTRRLLEVNPTFQVFVPRLVDEVNADNVQRVLDDELFYEQNRVLQSFPPTSRVARRARQFKREALESYRREPRMIYGRNQLRASLADTAFQPLVAAPFAVFIRPDLRSAFLLAEGLELISYCQQVDRAPVVRRDLRIFLNSKPLRELLTCGELL